MYFSLTICVPLVEPWCQQRKLAVRRVPKDFCCRDTWPLVGEAVELIEQSPIDIVLMSNTIPYTSRLSNSTKIRTVSVANLFGQAIKLHRLARIYLIPV